MVDIDMRKIYRFYPLDKPVDPANLPSGGDLYYECLECKGIVSSVARIDAACSCGNLSGGGGKVAIREPARITVVRGRLK